MQCRALEAGVARFGLFHHHQERTDPEVDALESLDRADQALTLAKTAGRNRVIVWDPSVTTGVRLRRLELKDIEG